MKPNNIPNYTPPKITPYIPGDHNDEEGNPSDEESAAIMQSKIYESSLLNQSLDISESRFSASELKLIK